MEGPATSQVFLKGTSSIKGSKSKSPAALGSLLIKAYDILPDPADESSYAKHIIIYLLQDIYGT